MGRGMLTPEEVQILKKNPNVIYVEEKRIVYAHEFKLWFIEEYQNGKRPGLIFKEAGFDIDILGSKRIERASQRWREAFAAGRLGDYEDAHVRHENAVKRAKEKKDSVDRTIRKQQTIIKRLEQKIAKKSAEIEQLKKTIALILATNQK